MKEDDRNKMFGDKAEEYLLKAKEYEPDREEVIVALGDLYDKMGNIEKAEEYYKMILEKNRSIWEENEEDPQTYQTLAKSYYTLANFYEKNGNTDLAQEMYKERINLNPKDPDGYHYFVGYLQNQRRWEEAAKNHEKRLYAMLDPDIIDLMAEIDKLQADTEEVKKTTEFINTVKKNKRVSAEEKERLLAEATDRIKDKLPVDEAENKMVELKDEMEKKIKRAEATADTLEEDKKQKVAETYYSIGNVCWNWSYQTPSDFMAPEQRKPILEKGLSNLEKATTLAPDYADPYAYMGLLWREMIKVDPLKRDEFVKKNEEYNKRFTEIYKKKKRQEEYRKQLEDMGQDEES
jgi:tetratricopeptide (TPR) repeat protein